MEEGGGTPPVRECCRRKGDVVDWVYLLGGGPLPAGWVHGFWGRDVILFSSLLLHVSKKQRP